MSETSARPQPEGVPTKSSPILETEKASQSLHDPSVDQVQSDTNPQNDLEAPDLQEPGPQTLDQEDGKEKVRRRREEDLSDSESDDELESRLRYRAKAFAEPKQESALRAHQAAKFFRLMDERMTSLETELAELKQAKATSRDSENELDITTTEKSPEYGDEYGDDDNYFVLPKLPYRKIDEQEWKVFRDNEGELSVIEILTGEVGVGSSKWFTDGLFNQSVKSIVSGNTPEPGINALAVERQISLLHRVKIHSHAIIAALEKVTSSARSSDSHCTLVAPFKTLVLFETDIRNELNRLNDLCPDKVEGTASAEKGPEVGIPQSEDQYGISRIMHSKHREEPNGGLSESPRKGPTEQLALSREETKETLLAIAELRVLVEFIDTRLKGTLDIRRQIRDGTLRKISFSSLFLLFNAGDVVFAEGPKKQACKVFSASGGLPLNKFKTAENRNGSHSNGLYSYNEHDTTTPFIIDCYHLAFDGNTYGPVQKTFVIPYFAGEKQISSLPICPEKLHERGSDLRDQLLKNGKLFVELVQDGQSYAHRTYEGGGETPKGDTEEIDSQVIIDFAATFGRHSQWALKLGLEGATPQDPRQMVDCRLSSSHFFDDKEECVMCVRDSFWQEEQIESRRSSEYLASVRDDLQSTQSASDLKGNDNKLILLPATVFGFALRSRKWVALNIENVRDLSPPEEAFDDLVIKPDHKRLVQALVKTHARTTHVSGKAFPNAAEDYQADIVRGKGKGLIILLHGPPGVGKTSTAECVADLTRRPLFSITCGDIGTEPETVERTLDENFLLAHRWECVLLLDEADVFLQERDRTNLKRNSLVSVFLRTLEYYSGILFLTVGTSKTSKRSLKRCIANLRQTNREGTLDEAFKSRIHISLHYQRPERLDWLKIWENNIRRVSKHYDVNGDRILKWAKRNFERLNWNGRQIRNAFQAATALAKFSAQESTSGHSEKNPISSRIQLRIEDFKDVAKASIGFDEYLQSIYGLDKIEDRFLREKVRNDRFISSPMVPNNNFNPIYQPQTSAYQNLQQMPQPNITPYQQQQAPAAFHQSSGHHGRRPATQHQPHVQGSTPFQNMEGKPNGAACDGSSDDEDDMQ